MNKAELQAESAADVKEVQALMAAKNIRVEGRQRIDTETGFIETIAVFVSEKRLDDAVAPTTTEEVAPIPAEAAVDPAPPGVSKTDAEHAG